MFVKATDILGKKYIINERDIARFKECGFEDRAKYKLDNKTMTLYFSMPQLDGRCTVIGLKETIDDIESQLILGLSAGKDKH